MNELLRWAEGNLLVLLFGDASAKALHRLRSLAQSAPVRCVQVVDGDARPHALEFVRDPKGHLQGACHVFGHAWAVVRPDSYVAATGEGVDASLVHALSRALGTELEEEHA
jgi:3-(3-hydroxy-phenyl)propionate hydroxylase